MSKEEVVLVTAFSCLGVLLLLLFGFAAGNSSRDHICRVGLSRSHAATDSAALYRAGCPDLDAEKSR